ncbi:hypothetical protein QMK61_02375 [Fulvimonas sp. R45]|uniref:hypothetical protein n=1 Tax=Fulvimonas sp. R45 TaxID=3045937 RepID=UPI00265F454B|nr:hypothetical protein [Fulvimonas sp. R45]MDO1527666.1 hypothetical protein [Fulvimonas sp. R45]
MNEFEWRRQMRALRQPVAPRQDLWARIDAALDTAAPIAGPAPRRRHRVLLAAGLAAALLLAAGLGWQLHRGLATPSATQATHTPAAHAPGPVAPWKPDDPRLAGAAIVLDAAQMELRQALRQAPASPALQRLLSHTQQQQASLRQLEHQAG